MSCLSLMCRWSRQIFETRNHRHWVFEQHIWCLSHACWWCRLYEHEIIVSFQWHQSFDWWIRWIDSKRIFDRYWNISIWTMRFWKIESLFRNQRDEMTNRMILFFRCFEKHSREIHWDRLNLKMFVDCWFVFDFTCCKFKRALWAISADKKRKEKFC